MRSIGMKYCLGTFVLVMAAALTTGCYKTVVRSQAEPEPGPTHRARQWFTVGGLVSLSDPAGEECENGIARAESRMAPTDILINVGLGLAGSLMGAAVCDDDADPATYAGCVQGAGALVPFLFATRTVTYSCIAGERAELPLIPGQTKTAEARDAPTGE